jgi:hypothetical protein
MSIEFKGEPKKSFKVGTVQTVDVQTGEVVEERRNAFTLLPPGPGVCPVCATDHGHDQPHNKQSIYYQIAFQAAHGRYPTWSEAMSHCPPAVRAAWEAELRKRGAWDGDEGGGA